MGEENNCLNAVCIDTNIILLDAYNIVTLSQNYDIIYIPETVLDELDSKKSLMNELGFQSRQFGRLLSSGTKGTRYVQPVDDNLLHMSPFEIEGAHVVIVSSVDYPSFRDTDPSILNDRKILYIAQLLSCTFMSNDVMCRIRAESLGLDTVEFKIVENLDFEFVKELELSPALFSIVHDKPITEVDPDYKPENYNYKFTCPMYNQVKLATLANGLVKVIGKETETELRKQDINPKNAEQLFLSKALQDPTVDIVVCESLAGSGKTIVSLSNAMRMVDKGKYDSIIYIRASVDDVDDQEAVGFLSGNEEKFAVYLHPLEDSLRAIVRSHYSNTKLKGQELEEFLSEKTEEFRSKYNIVAMTGLGMRGRTFMNSIVIIDEFQNQSKASAQKMLTRFGEGCKIVVLGSNRQIDNKYLTKYTNGFSTLLAATAKEQENLKLHAVTLQKVVRGPIAEFAELIYSKDQQ